MKKTKFLKPLATLSLALLAFSCTDDDSPSLETWEVEVNELKSVTAKYIDFSVAESEGLTDVSGYVPNMGHHYMNASLVDGTFEINKPEYILYAPDENNVMQMIAVEYGVVPEDVNNPGNPPEGFTGDQDVWKYKESVGQWQLHVWTILENPDGIFAPYNTVMGD